MLILGKWIACFKEAINKYESTENCILGKIARINEHLKHQDSNYFNAIGKYCFFYYKSCLLK